MLLEGLRDAAGKESTIRISDAPYDLRFDFADEVIVEWLSADADQAPIIGLREGVLALALRPRARRGIP